MSVGNLWLRKQPAGWYCKVDGKQKRLASVDEGKKVAEYRHAQLVIKDNAAKDGGNLNNDNQPCKVILQLWLDTLQGTISPLTQIQRVKYVSDFTKLHGEVSVSNLRRHHVSQWLAGHTTWNDTTKLMALQTVMSAFKWAVNEEYITRNPAQGVPRPRPKKRGEEVILTEQEIDRLLKNANPHLHDILFAMFRTGCRPGEVMAVEAKDFLPELKCWQLLKHKTFKKTGPKKILLCPMMVDLTLKLSALHPQGPLFRRKGGLQWTGNAMREQLHALAKKCGVEKRVIPYCTRHNFIHHAVMRNVPDTKVAALVGHTSTKYIAGCYAKTLQRVHELGDDLLKALGDGPDTKPVS